jgi:spore maturation protein SpmA
VLNGIFVFLIFSSILLAAWTGRMQFLTEAILKEGGKAVDLAIGLVGVMALFLGLMRVAEQAGLLKILARIVAPVMRRLFPEVPPDHPAMSAMILNIGSNMMGLANAATPFGIRAIEELDKLNGRKGTATNAMVLFLAINTAGLAVLPSGVIGIRAALGSENAAAIFFPTWFASGCATLVGIVAALLLSRLPRYRASAPPVVSPSGDIAGPAVGDADESVTPTRWRSFGTAAFFVAYLLMLGRFLIGAVSDLPPLEVAKQTMSYWILPAIVAALVLFGWSRGVRVYDAVVEGAKEGFQVALRIIPFLVAILVAVGMFRASGGIDLLVRAIGPLTGLIGMPAEALPMAVLRPLTGSGALAVMSEIMTAHGPDSFIGYMVSTFQGSTETTFYVLAVYFGAVGVKRTRHALPACLMADAAGILAAVFIVNLFFG